MADIAKIETVSKVLADARLAVPEYQRPYKWSIRTAKTLLDDILFAIAESEKHGSKFKYRVGTIILHREIKDDKEVLNIVDGQQRVITLVFIQQVLGINSPILQSKIEAEVSRKCLLANHTAIKEFIFGLKVDDRTKFINAFEQILEFVVVTIESLSEAFQLFDSQNHRGKSLIHTIF